VKTTYSLALLQSVCITIDTGDSSEAASTKKLLMMPKNNRDHSALPQGSATISKHNHLFPRFARLFTKIKILLLGSQMTIGKVAFSGYVAYMMQSCHQHQDLQNLQQV